jgi:Flp pilus assembly protein TadG
VRTITRAYVRFFRQSEGASLIELALLLPVLTILLVGAADFGQASYQVIEVSSAAHAGAMYGARNPTDTAGMIAAARLDAPDVGTITPVASYGCECSDGTLASASCTVVPTCTYNVLYYVQVNTSSTYSSMLRYPGIPASLTLHGQARMRAAY